MNYTVKKGDTLWDLSRKYGIPLQDLLRQMPEQIQRDPRKLMPGMSLTLPGRDRAAPAASQGPSRQVFNSGYPDYMVPGRDLGNGFSTIPERDRSIPEPYPKGFQHTQQPQSTLQRLYNEAPEQAMKMLQGMPPTQLAAGAGRLAGVASKGNYAERLGEQIERPFAQVGQRYDNWQAGRAADRLGRQRIDDAMTGGAERGGAQFEPLMQGQTRVRDIIDQGGGANIPLQPDVGSMARNNPNMSLGSLHRFMSPGEMPAGSMVRPHPSRVPTTVRPNPDREMYQQGFERMPTGGWGKNMYDSSKVPKRAPTKEEEEVYALLLASRDMNPTAVQNAASRMGHGDIMKRFTP